MEVVPVQSAHEIAVLAADAIEALVRSNPDSVLGLATGSTPLDWLRRERISEAKRRLSQSKEPIRVIAEELGYGDQFYFSRDFKKLVGLSPRHYRRQEVENRG